ncbi:preprotein translocase subunit SecG [Candidatus Peregrinibacteria bacterium]|jgi:protein translocase SecG subunit|nr:preprotein translocase subunit SecG [Candidatus Peregrinibacteria bacterium]MBT4056404.1 preprotein translocase subunit SecG [Candidatus Peregrinibacteria bacterium]
MKTTLFVFQIIISLLLVISVLTQQRGTGLSATFGGGGGGFYSSKRGAEKVLSVATVVLSVLFVLNSLAFLFVD